MLKARSERLKYLGLATLLIPIGFLLVFLFGEVYSGDLSGFGHLVQLLPILVLVWVGYKWPYWAGILLALAGIVLGAMYAYVLDFSFQIIIFVEAVLFIPLILSGILLIISGKSRRRGK